MPSPIHLIDDDAEVLAACGFLLQTIGYDPQLWADAREFFARADLSRPGIVLSDLNMPWLDGRAVQQQLQAAHSPMALVVLTGFGEVSLAVEMLKQGAVDFLEKPVSLPRLQQALAAAETATQQAARQQLWRARYARLSPKEQAVAALIVAGYTNKAMAENLHLAVRTIEVHRANIMDKMQAEHLPQLVQMLAAIEEVAAD